MSVNSCQSVTAGRCLHDLLLDALWNCRVATGLLIANLLVEEKKRVRETIRTKR